MAELMRIFKSRLADGERIEICGVAVRLKVSRRARRVSLRVDPARGEVIAVAPSARRLADALAFARERRGWMEDRLAAAPAPWTLEGNDVVALFGEPTRLGLDPRLVFGAIKLRARQRFSERAGVHCAALAVTAPPIRLTDARTRWGSCTPAGRGRPASIRLSWRLALAPLAVADYVVAHECAHLLESNHGPAFWSHVRALVGDPRPHRAWLQAHGACLHALRAKPTGSL
ncbi:MAG: M48 family metallopeptidase [Caulobacteraceae bacterium]